MVRARRLSVLLLKETVESFDDAFKDAAALKRFDMVPSILDGTLYVRESRKSPPSWLSFIEPGLPERLELPDNASSAAVLLVRAASRIFAITFGYGRSLLDPFVHESDFGLRVTLNSVDPDSLRSIDIRRFEEMTFQTRRQTSRQTSITSFGLDISRDMLRAVTGTPHDHKLALTLSGADSLSMSSRIELSNLPRLCTRLLEAHTSGDYVERFGWIDNLAPVKDADLSDRLDDCLVKQLNLREFDHIHMSVPEQQNWQDITGFYYHNERTNRDPHYDLDMADYLDVIGNPSVIDIKTLLKHKIRVRWVEQDQVFSKWAVYDCIVFETELNGSFYVLTNGQWFKIAKSFVETLNQFVLLLPKCDANMPNALLGENEGEYNTRAASCLPESICLDKRLVSLDGVRGQVEICDIFTRDSQWIHVKRMTDSATLSHLFAQGEVSAEAFLGDQAFRERIREQVRKQSSSLASLIPEARPKPIDYEVVYAVIDKSTKDWPLRLPFFSRLHLMQATRRLQTLGFRVSTMRIKIEP